VSLFTIITDACDQLSLPRPSAVIGSSDEQVRQLLRLANNEGRSLAARHDWQALTAEHSFTTVAADAQTSSIPADFARIKPETMFNRTRTRKVEGPLDSKGWQEYKSSLVTPFNPIFRIRGNTILLSPVPTAGDSIYYEYVSNKWCQNLAGDTSYAAWNADTNTGKIDEYLMTLGIVWRFRASKKLGHAEELAAYEREVADAILRDGSRARLNMGQVTRGRVWNSATVPDELDL
jgi:hypothetical protein